MAAEEDTSPETTSAADKLTAEYELPDDTFDPELDAESAAGTEPTQGTPPTPASATPPRGPDGKFIKPEPPKHSARLVEMAKDHGLTQAEIDAYTPENLEVVLFDRHKQNVARQQAERTSKETKPTAPTDAPPAEDDLLDFGMDPDTNRKIDAEDIHPGIRNVLEKLAKEVRELRDMKPAVRELHQNVVLTAREQEFQQIDRTFEGTDESVFGKGRPAGGSAEMDRRNYILDQAKKLTGKEKPTLNEILSHVKPAVERLYPSSASYTPTTAKPTASREVEEWNNGTVLPPTHRRPGPPAKGKDAAKKAVANFMRDRPDVLSTNGTEADELPD